MASVSPSEGYSDSLDTPGSAMMPPSEKTIHKIPNILPRERVFPIQIGSELFKLSGASLSSDANSTIILLTVLPLPDQDRRRAWEDIGNAIRTLYIDRDPETFRDIALHLQGYHVSPRDGKHFVRLFADAQFYSLPKLVSQLYEESIFISIGHREFQIPREVLTDPRNSPNYFSLGFAFFFSRPDNLFPGLDREGLIRPPSILPPSVPGRNADTFAELLRLLRGYPLQIRDETHRQELLRDAKYFHFKGLEQQLIPHSITFNSIRGYDEILLKLENVQKSGISIVQEGSADDEAIVARINYARPHVDDRPAELILEIGNESSRIHFGEDGVPRVEFFRDTKTRVAKLLEVIATKLNLPPTTQPLGLLMAAGGAGSQPATPGNTSLSEDLVRAAFETESAIVLDGKDYIDGSLHSDPSNGDNAQSRKRKRTDGSNSVDGPWTVKTGQWRLRIQPSNGGKNAVECVFIAVRIDAVSSERERNSLRGFLG